jgi:hypothetical protein
MEIPFFLAARQAAVVARTKAIFDDDLNRWLPSLNGNTFFLAAREAVVGARTEALLAG